MNLNLNPRQRPDGFSPAMWKRVCSKAGRQNERSWPQKDKLSGLDVAQQYIQQEGRCHYCEAELGEKGWHIDHVTPLSKGGPNTASNIVCACKACNDAKGVTIL